VIVKQTEIKVSYLKSAELTKLDSIVNREPFFEIPLIDRYVFDIAEAATNSFTAGLGKVID